MRLWIGYTNGADGPEKLYLDEEDLETHVHGIGGTRTGKSKLIEWIARELIRNRAGFCLIDPHGQLYDELVMWLTYLRPDREMILFNPSSTDRIVGFNPFTHDSGDIGARVDRLVRATAKAWGEPNADATPRMERWLRVLYTTVLQSGETIDITKFLFEWSERDVAAVLTARVTDDLVLSELATLKGYTRAQDFDGQIESSKNRLFRFLSSQQIRRVMGLSTNNIDVEDIIEKGKVLLVNLQPSETLSEDQSRLVGTLLLNEIWEVAMRRRPSRASEKPRPFYVILDEFQKFLTPTIPDMLDQAAKYGIHLMLFHQRLDQLRARDPEAYSAVMTNARIKLVFGALSREDARTMVEQIFPGQVDMKQVKNIIEQTKFWPVYGRDVVRSRGSSTGSGHTSSSGQTWNPYLEEFVPSDGRGDTETSSWQEGEADIPIFYPEPFREVSSVEYYSLEEVLWQMSDRLMEQYQRHFMVRRPGRPTEPAITPFLKQWYAKPESTARYVDRVLGEFLSGAEVDLRLSDRRELLLQAAEPQIEASESPRSRKAAVPRKQSATGPQDPFEDLEKG